MLKQVNGPQDIKDLSLDELEGLTEEIRNRIIGVCSETGGHLGASLGATDLIVALHYVFDSPRDRFVFDVGHQAYAHKLLTGRDDRFDTVRQTDGLCGFPRLQESEHDYYTVGHASTSIAAAAGYSAADPEDSDRHNIAIVGDGGLTGGIAWAGLNNVHQAKPDKFMVVLNDNGMSIAHNVGTITRYLSQFRSHPNLRDWDQRLKDLLEAVPFKGRDARRAYEKFKESMLYFFSTSNQAPIFEELGLGYLGPFDGHDVKDLVKIFQRAREMEIPVLTHLITTKGKGYDAAEGDPVTYHGVKAGFDEDDDEESTDSGKLPDPKPPKNAVKSYSTVFAETVTDFAREDEEVRAVTAAMPGGTKLEIFNEHFPDRCFDVGIAEDCAVSFSTAMALAGRKVFCAIYSTFLQRAYDQVIHDAGLMQAPVRFCLDRSGIVGGDGETHQGIYDIAYLRCIPDYVVMAPAEENELRHMLYTMLHYDEGPIAVRYPRGNGIGVEFDSELETIEIGSGEVRYHGEEVALIGYGNMVPVAEEAAELLRASDLNPTVINARFAKPLDEELLLDAANRHRLLVTLEEHQKMGGFGSAVGELLHRERVTTPLVKVGIDDTTIPHGDPDVHRDRMGLSPRKVAERVTSELNRERRASS